MLELDLEYSDELHDLHKSYPLAPTKTTIPHENLLPYSKNLADTLNSHYNTES